MFRLLMILSALLVCVTLSRQASAQVSGQNDCTLAERYYALAQDRLGAYEEDEAATYLERAAAACPRFAYFQELGELRMTFVDQEDRQLAVDAFIESYALGSSDKERARALWKYAALLNQEGDPQNADRLIRDARRLDQNNQEISRLAAEIQTQNQNPTQEQLVRGLADSLYKPLRMASTSDRNSGVTSSPGVPDSSTPSADGPSINIPINFEFNSTEVDSATASNIELLARTLSAGELDGRSFEFVGHADTRGEWKRNWGLSEQRATKIYKLVIAIEPSLAERISTRGMGESDPIEPGDTEEAHLANRRLQILVK